MTRTIVAVGGLLAGFALVSAIPDPARGDGSVTFGSQWWEQDAPEAKYQEFSVVPQGAFISSFALRESYDRNWFSLYGVNGLRKDQSSSLSWSNGVRWRLDLGYQEIPHRFSETGRTPFSEAGQGVWTLPDSLQSKIQGTPSTYVATMTDLLAGASPVDLSFRTDVSRARMRARPARGWQFELKGTRRQRSGKKPYGAPFGFNSAIELPEQISQRMVDADARASFQRERVNVELTGGVSLFDNKVDVLRWDNPKRLTDTTYAAAYVAGDGSRLGQMDLYPDNRSVRGAMALGYQLPRQSAFSASVAMSQNTQNDPWLPYTVNGAIPEAVSTPLPGTNTDGKATVLTQDYRLTSRPQSKLSGTLRFRQHHYDNKTPVHEFDGYVRMDQVWEPIRETAEPFGNKQTSYGVDLDWKPVSRATLAGTFEVLQRERTHREVEKDKENAFTAQARVRPHERLDVKVAYRRGDRKVDEFLEEDYKDSTGTRFIEQPGLRRFDVADRVQDKVDAGASWSVGERVTVSTGYSYLRNDFKNSDLGLQMETQRLASADAYLSASDRLDLSGGLGWNQSKTEQRSWQSGAAISTNPDSAWAADITDWSLFAIGAVEWQAAPDRLSFVGGFEYEESPGTYMLSGISQSAKDLPDTRHDRRDFSLEGRYHAQRDMDIAIRYDIEKYRFSDFASTGIPLLSPTTGTVNAIYLGDNLLNYTAHRAAVEVTRTW